MLGEVLDQLRRERSRIDRQIAVIEQADTIITQQLAKVREVLGDGATTAPLEGSQSVIVPAVADDTTEVAIAAPEASPGRQGGIPKLCSAPGCNATFTPAPLARKRLYCSDRCRGRAAIARRRHREDVGWQAQTARLRDQHVAEGYTNGSRGA